MTALAIILGISVLSNLAIVYLYLKHIKDLEVLLTGRSFEDLVTSLKPEMNDISVMSQKDLTDIDPEIGIQSIKQLVKTKHGR